MTTFLGLTFSAGGLGSLVGAVCVGCADADPLPKLVAEGSTLGSAEIVAIHGDRVYWATEKDVRSAPATGGAAPTILASDQNNLVDFLVDDIAVYWAIEGTPELDGSTRDGAIVMQPLAGGPIAVLADHLDRPHAIAIDGGQVYWTGGRPPALPTDPSVGYVMSVSLAGGVPSVLVSALSFVGAVAARDGTVVYSASDDDLSHHTHIVRLDPRGESAVLAMTDHFVNAIVFADSRVYWAESNSFTVDGGLPSDGRVRSIPLAGGSFSTLADVQSEPHSLTVSGDQVLWANYEGWYLDGSGGVRATSSAIYSGMKAGGVPIPVVSRQQNVVSFATDAHHLAWVEYPNVMDGSRPPGSLLIADR